MTIVLDKPQPKQLEFMGARARFVAYGGARGGGKSWSVRFKCVALALRWPKIRILILRRTFPELEENHIQPLRNMLRGVVKYNDGKKRMEFPNGSVLKFGYCKRDQDVNQYQGTEWDCIFMDEATHFTEHQYSTLTACLRGVNHFPKRMYLTCNPGGVGHAWVKRLFVDREYRGAERPEDYIFIPAKSTDNKVLVDTNPGYISMLDNLPDGIREAWRDGKWDVFQGQYFTEFDTRRHVVVQMTLPSHWPRYRAYDYGLDMLAVLWGALDPDGRWWIYRELQAQGQTISQAARLVLEATPADEVIEYDIMPPDLWTTQKTSGKTIVEHFVAAGLSPVKSSNRRIHGWLTVKEYMVQEQDGRAMVQIMASCPTLIKNIQLLQYDDKIPSDVAKEPHEITHNTDALRYLLVSRTMAAEVVAEDEEDEGSADYLFFGGVL